MSWKSLKRFRSIVYPEIIYNNKVCNTPETATNAVASYFDNMYTEKDPDLFDSSFKTKYTQYV